MLKSHASLGRRANMPFVWVQQWFPFPIMVEPPQIHDGNRRERLARAGVGGGGVRGGGGGGGGGNGVGSVLHEMQGQTGDGEPGEGITGTDPNDDTRKRQHEPKTVR